MNSAGSAWERVKDARGRVFYVNHITREVGRLYGRGGACR